MKKTPFVLAALCGLAVTSALHAQTTTVPPPPKVLQIFREIVKPGHGAAHAKVEAGWPAAFMKASSPAHSPAPYLAMTSTSGPNEAWFVTGWDSYAAFEKDAEDSEKNTALQTELERLSAADGDHLSNTSSMFATYRDDLSYRAGVNIPQMRYFQLTTYRVKPGRGAEFAAARKIVQAVHEKLNMDEHWAMYQVTSGAPGGTYLLIMPIKSMAEIDAAQEMHGQAYDAALGAENQKKVGDLLNSSVESSTSTLLRFSPKMSYPPKEWVAADAFWAPVAAKFEAKVPATKKVN
jgi:hypothetical protein